MKAFEVIFGNTKLWGTGSLVEISLTVIASDLTEALMKSIDALESVKAGLIKAGCLREVSCIRVLGIEERDPVINPGGNMDPELIKDIVASMKEDLATE